MAIASVRTDVMMLVVIVIRVVFIGVIFLANVPHHLSLLASGIRGCSAAEMPEVPQA
jgi:hypothetical protein